MTPSLRSGGREEVDRLAHGEWFDVRRLEAELPHARHDFLLELGIVELTRNHAHVGDLTRGFDPELEHEFALQLRLVAQRTAIDVVQRTLVAIEEQLDFLARTRGLAARARALHAATGIRIESRAVLDLRGSVLA